MTAREPNGRVGTRRPGGPAIGIPVLRRLGHPRVARLTLLVNLFFAAPRVVSGSPSDPLPAPGPPPPWADWLTVTSSVYCLVLLLASCTGITFAHDRLTNALIGLAVVW